MEVYINEIVIVTYEAYNSEWEIEGKVKRVTQHHMVVTVEKHNKVRDRYIPVEHIVNVDIITPYNGELEGYDQLLHEKGY
ncbi:hypothetical protein P4H82_27495 [Bacillus cereus]|nr:hypothetical protein [Bacillus cereus]MEB9190471.1 hypothetical protein [Bacillus cereus]